MAGSREHQQTPLPSPPQPPAADAHHDAVVLAYRQQIARLHASEAGQNLSGREVSEATLGPPSGEASRQQSYTSSIPPVEPLQIRIRDDNPGSTSEPYDTRQLLLQSSARAPLREPSSLFDSVQLDFLRAQAFQERGKSFSSNSNTESEARTNSTALSISKFPRPPSGITLQQQSRDSTQSEQLPATVYSPSLNRQLTDISQQTAFRDEIPANGIGPDFTDFNDITPNNPYHQPSGGTDLDQMAFASPPARFTPRGRSNTPSGESFKSGKDTLPARAIFEDLPTAYSSITKSPILANIPLPPAPVAVRRRSSNFKTTHQNVLDEEEPLFDKPDSPSQKPPPSPTWKEKFNNIFNRKPGASSTGEDTKESKPSPDRDSIFVAVPSPARPSTYLTPFNRDSVASQSVPAVYGIEPWRTEPTQIVPATDPNLSYHYYDDSSLYRTSIGGAPTGSFPTLSDQGLGNMSSDLGHARADRQERREGTSFSHVRYSEEQAKEPELSQDYGHSFKLHDLPQNTLSKTALRSTVGSIIKKYGDSGRTTRVLEEIKAANDEQEDFVEGSQRPKAKHMISGLSQFDFGLSNAQGQSPKVSPSQSPDLDLAASSSQAPPLSVSGPREPPGTAPPINLPFENRRVSSLKTMKSSGSAEGSFNSSYDNTGELLDFGPRAMSTTVSESASGSRGTGKASLGALTDLSDKDLNAGSRHSNGLRPPLPRDRSNFGHDSSNSNSGISIVSYGRQSHPSSNNIRGAGLEREISRELRRFSVMSGVSNLSGHVFVVNEEDDDSHSEDQYSGDGSYNSDGRLKADLSRGSLSNDPSFDADDIDVGGSVAGSQRYTNWDHSQSKNSYQQASLHSSVSAGSSGAFDLEEREEDIEEEADEGGDWVTVGGSTNFGTRSRLYRDTTGSSIADNSSRGSLSPEHRDLAGSPDRPRRGLLSPVEEVFQHPADDRYIHSYRMRDATPEGDSILLPAYDFRGGAGFPNRNALTPPRISELFADKTYQHPVPLSKQHVNPFKSSPPPVVTEKTLFNTRSPLIPLQKDFEASPVVRSVKAMGPTVPNDSFSSSIWKDTFNQHHEQGEAQLPTAEGSFAKMTILGPKINITGTPEGTGMRQVGSSIADASSPGQMWSSSPYRNATSPIDRIEPLTPELTPIQMPESAMTVRRQGPSEGDISQPDFLYNEIRRHREQLAQEGLLFDHIDPPSARIKHSRSQTWETEIDYPRPHHQNMPSRVLKPMARPVSYNMTPPIPRSGMRERMFFDEAHLHQFPHEESSVHVSVFRRKRQLSRAVFALCCLFPPLLLLFGYGMMDTLMVSLSHGEISRFGHREKRAALIVGWGFAGSAIFGIVIGMVVIGVRG